MNALKELKGDGATRAWLQEQVEGGFWLVCQQLLASLYDEALLSQAGFHVFKTCLDDEKNGMLIEDDEIANTHVRLVLSVVSSRIRRCMYFFKGWPGQTFALLSSAKLQKQTILEFKTDHEAYARLKSAGGLGDVAKRMLSRHVMNCVVNKQWAAGFELADWAPTAQLRSLAAERAGGVMSSIPCETLFNVMKNRRQERGRVKVSVPPRCMGIGLASNVASAVHKFETLPSDVALPQKTAKLSKEAFGMGKTNTSMNFPGVASARATPPYFSPKAENVSLPAADLPFIRKACDDGWRVLELGFFGAFCHWKHFVVFKRDVLGGGHNFDWRCALGHFQGSSCYA